MKAPRYVLLLGLVCGPALFASGAHPRPVAPIAVMELSTGRTVSLFEEEDDLEPLDLPVGMALAFRPLLYGDYLLTCAEGGGELRLADVPSGRRAWLSRPLGRLRDGRLRFRTALGTRWTMLFSEEPLSGCLLRGIREEESRRRLIEQTLGQVRPRSMGHGLVLEELQPVDGVLQRKPLHLETALDGPLGRILAVLVGERFPAQAFEREDLLRPFSEIPPGSGWYGQWGASARAELPVEAGYLEVSIRPLLRPGEVRTEGCMHLRFDGCPAAPICFPLSPLPGKGEHPGYAPLQETLPDGSVVGRLYSLRLALPRTIGLEVRYDGSAWLQATRFTPIWREPGGTNLPAALVLARSEVDYEGEAAGPPLRRSTVLGKALLELRAAAEADRQPLRGAALRWYYRELQWQPLTPESDKQASGPEVKELLRPVDPALLEQLREEEGNALWVPIGEGGEEVPLQVDARGRSSVQFLLERLTEGPTPCVLELAGRTVVQYLDQPMETLGLEVVGMAQLPLLLPGETCRPWQRIAIDRIGQGNRPATRHRLFRLGPSQTLRFGLPGPRVPGILRLEVLGASQKDVSRLRVETGGTELQFEHRGSEDLAGAVFEVPAATVLVELENLGPETWVALQLRAPIDRSIPETSIPGSTPAPDEAARKIAELSNLLGSSSQPDDQFEWLLERASLLAESGVPVQAGQDLFQAHNLVSTLDQLGRVSALQNRFEQGVRATPPGEVRPPYLMPWSGKAVFLPRGMREKLLSPGATTSALGMAGAGEYAAMWEALQRLDDPVQPLEPLELVLLHGVAVRFGDWSVAARVSRLLVEREPGRSRSEQLVVWLREVLRAEAAGQILPPELRVEAAVAAWQVQAELGEDFSTLAASITASCRREQVFGFTESRGRKVVPRQERSTGPDETKRLAALRALWGTPSPPEQVQILLPGERRLIELSLSGAFGLVLETVWRTDGAPGETLEGCVLSLRAKGTVLFEAGAPSHTLGAVVTRSTPIGVSVGRHALSLGLECPDATQRPKVRVRLLADRELPGLTVPSEGTPPSSESHVLVLSGDETWLELPAKLPSELEVIGPDLLELRWQAPRVGTIFDVRLLGPRGVVREEQFVAAAPGEVGEQTLVLPEDQVYRLVLRPSNKLDLQVFHLVPEVVPPGRRMRLERALAPSLDVGGSAGGAQPGPAPALEELGTHGTLWTGLFARNDALDLEQDLGSSGTLVFGPELGWHSCAPEHFCWKVDSQLRLRSAGTPGGVVEGEILVPSFFGSVLRPGARLATQRLLGEWRWTSRVDLAVEYPLRLSTWSRLTPFVGAQITNLGLTSAELGQTVPTSEVDTLVHNAYREDHPHNPSLGLKLAARPRFEDLIVAASTLHGNSDWEFWYPDRFEHVLSWYHGHRGGMVRPEVGLGYRYADLDRLEGSWRPHLGLAAGHAHWLARDLRLQLQAGARWAPLEGSALLSVALSLVWCSGRGVTDDPATWLPQSIFYELNRPEFEAPPTTSEEE